MTIPQLLLAEQDWRHPSYLPPSATPTHRSSNHGSSRSSSSSSWRPKMPNAKKGFWRKLISALLPVVILLFLIGGLAALAGLAWISKDLPSPDGVINRSITVSTKIYDRTGNTVLYDIHGDVKRTIVTLNDIPQNAINATLAAEDRDFYKHGGVSWTGILRSLLKNIFTGSKVGGSTLTQQFVKNAILTNEKTYTRKIKEVLLSYQLEKKFSKNDILQMYFNEIPYGSVVYGIEAASQTYFGKPAKDLTLAEGAILAAIPQSPTYYSPYGTHQEELLARQRWILESMKSLNMITASQAAQAEQEKIIFKPMRDSIIAPHFVMYIKDLLSQKYGDDVINQDGLKVYTTLDLDKQRMAEKAITDGVALNGKKYNFTNASLVSLDPKTGQILAMVGSADYFNTAIDGQVNVALSSRQPGSSFKPIVYTAAFLKGYTPNTVLDDVNTNFDTTGAQPYTPHDYDLKERGPVTIREALAGSLNIPAVEATYLTGINNVLDLADKLGYTTLKDRSRFGLSLVLGGGEVKLLEHTNTYATFANEGIRHDINPILKIEDKNGQVLYEYKDNTQQVIDTQAVRQLTSILSDDNARAYIFGKGSKLTLPGRPVAVKTGTTNDYHDAWTMGYTPSLVTGVWVGNSNNDQMKKGADGSIVAAPIWNEYMQNALKDTSVEQFNAPDPVVTGKPVLDGDKSITKTIKIDSTSGQLATDYTPVANIKEVTVNQPHSILYYINKDDPRGSAPTNPNVDPQFTNWEVAVIDWAKRNNLYTTTTNGLPTAYDSVHKPEDQPTLSIVSPLSKQTVRENTLSVQITAKANRGIKKVEYYIDNNLLLTKADTSDTVLTVNDLQNGYHTLTVEAKDDLDNTASQSVDINVLSGQAMPVLNWISPADKSTIKFPTALKADLANWQQVKKIDFYFVGQSTTTENYINYVTPTDGNVSLSWTKKPAPGSYLVYGSITDQKGKKYKTEQLAVVVK